MHVEGVAGVVVMVVVIVRVGLGAGGLGVGRCELVGVEVVEVGSAPHYGIEGVVHLPLRGLHEGAGSGGERGSDGPGERLGRLGDEVAKVRGLCAEALAASLGDLGALEAEVDVLKVIKALRARGDGAAGGAIRQDRGVRRRRDAAARGGGSERLALDVVEARDAGHGDDAVGREGVVEKAPRQRIGVAAAHDALDIVKADLRHAPRDLLGIGVRRGRRHAGRKGADGG
mmetsp:Transcript_60313/g.191599  ORF Transcript_60313/g.191599 Transcript_60313/m.191599 type:complete len:229 (-) Transcript_60313:158-844(-)